MYYFSPFCPFLLENTNIYRISKIASELSIRRAINQPLLRFFAAIHNETPFQGRVHNVAIVANKTECSRITSINCIPRIIHVHRAKDT